MDVPVPGFVDLQVNGFLGVDFSAPDLTAEAFKRACRALFAAGTVAFLPTLISAPIEVYQRNLPLIAGVLMEPEFQGRLLGIHLEGPFISPEPGAVGAHPPECVRQPDPELLLLLLEWAAGQVRLLTMAAELPGADELARLARSYGVTVSIGHSLATVMDMERMVEAGAAALTHLGNGLPNLIHRHENPIWAGLANDALTAMVIGDGHHLPPAVLKSFIRAKGATKIVVVSDASPIAGLPPGRYRIWGNDVVLESSGRLFSPGKQCLVGSSATLLQCINHLASLRLLTEDELVMVGFFNPLRLIGVMPDALATSNGVVTYDSERCQFTFRTSP